MTWGEFTAVQKNSETETQSESESDYRIAGLEGAYSTGH
jgi:hypothetical protein